MSKMTGFAMAVFLAAALLVPAARAAQDLTLRYDRPATKWDAEALPLGNGRIGCMIFGGVERERVQFNEDSLWTGGENPTGNYGSMGAFQNFGDLFIDLGGAAAAGTGPGVTCTSGQKAFYAHEEIDNTVDGKADTKWCLEHHGQPVVWQRQFAAPVALDTYAFVSCPDMPQRDPKTWEVQGSTDGKEWTMLDRRENVPPMADRGGKAAYGFKNSKAFSI